MGLLHALMEFQLLGPRFISLAGVRTCLLGTFPGTLQACHSAVPFVWDAHFARLGTNGSDLRARGASAAWLTFQIFGRGENISPRRVFSDFAGMPLGRALCLRRALCAP